MKLILFLCSAFIAGTASADQQAEDKAATQSAVPDMDKAVHIEREDVKKKATLAKPKKTCRRAT